ncbi:YgjP-like metallopeptidase domain-containing protein [Paucibacter sp. APW11]|uniref:YgjP-like metallopeptidase domain-containing protein n=1 Tax=Roseateles aquae TaxID=3077235 RepID=A0ABU3PDV8_9BURK|nr:YgjP-like metallopeptidase domain-containing protein [Paucibacter sp. APW11]MDT9000801.1 YgjP-like metallopeptidase domain-containing protein [Paucibacter sp. APW11]
MLNKLAGLLKSAQLSLFDSEPELPLQPAQKQQPKAPAPAPDGVPKPAPRRAKSAAPGHAEAATPSHEVLLDGHRIAYELRRARRRSIGFTVSEDGLRVAAPKWVPLAEIERALQQKAGWILRKLVEQRERRRRLDAAQVQWADGCVLPYLGEPMIVVLDPSAARLPGGARFDDGRDDSQPTLATVARQTLFLGLPQAASAQQIRDAVQAWLQRQARALFEQRCRHFAAQLGVQMNRLRLSSAQTRWGSASADGTVRLNWRLIHFAPSTIDYVVAHELAHLREMNHSPRFWAIVGQLMPDYERARAQLRQAALPSFDD